MQFQFDIKHQESYSRFLLLLRTFFGIFYIGLPHILVLIPISIWVSFLTFIGWWVALFTGKYPRSLFDQIIGLYRWNTRLGASLSNLSDKYPAFGFAEAEDDIVTLNVEYPENLSRSQLLLVALFGWLYVLIPHLFILSFYSIWISIITFLSWFSVLFTGKFPKSFFNQIVGYNRWSLRVTLYYLCLTTEYPPFSGE